MPESHPGSHQPLGGSGGLEGKLDAALSLQLQGFLQQGSAESLRAIVQHWQVWQPAQKRFLLQSEQPLTAAIRASLYDHDLNVKANAFAAIADLVDFELLDDLVRITVQPNYVHKETSALVLSQLAIQLHQQQRAEVQKLDALAAAENSDSVAQVAQDTFADHSGSEQATWHTHSASQAGVSAATYFQWPANRQNFRRQLEQAIENYHKHQRPEILLTYLLFSDFEDAWVKRALSVDSHPAHDDLLRLLFESRTAALIEKLAGFVGVQSPPVRLLPLWRQRNDPPFILQFLTSIDENPTAVTQRNLKRMGAPLWLKAALERVGDFSTRQQSALLLLIQQCVEDCQVRLDMFLQLLDSSRLPVRRQTVAAICEIKGVQANQVISYLVDQEADAHSLAILLPELRKRNVQGAMKRLLAFLDHSHEAVRTAAAQAFQDCNIGRYLAALDHLDEAVRVSTGQLVRKVDPNTDRVVRDELLSGNRIRQMRALIAIRSIGNATELHSAIAQILVNPDPKLRVAAVGTLANSKNQETRNQLRRCLMDEDPAVRKAAERSLQVAIG